MGPDSGGDRGGDRGATSRQIVAGVHLRRTDENGAEIAALGALLGGSVGIEAVLGDLNRRGRRTWAPGRAVRRAMTWDRADRATRRWWPQGISTCADLPDPDDSGGIGDTGAIGGRRVLVVTWYAKDIGGPHHGARVTFLDLDTRRYRHVLLVVPGLAADGSVSLTPLKVHAGGIVWCGPYLHIAATARGFMTCRVDDIMRVPDHLGTGNSDQLGIEGSEVGRVSTYGYRYVLPVRFAYRAGTEEGEERLRYSFLSLDRESTPPALVVGEYGGRSQTHRLGRFPLDPETGLLAEHEDGTSRPLVLEEGGVLRAQGATVVRGDYYLTVSQGPTTPGSVYVGRPGAFRQHRWATPIGPEDITYWPSSDMFWSVTEHPRRRWVYAMPRGWFDSRVRS